MKRPNARLGSLPALAALSALVLAFGAPSPAPAAGNPYADFIRESPTDQFNTRLSAKEKANPKPKRGGELVRRQPSDFDDFNPITSNSADATYALKLVAEDTLAKQHPETFEFVPWVADWWTIQDIVELEDGSRLVGLITELDGSLNAVERVVFSEGAKLLTVGKVDAELIDAGAGRLKLKDGREFEGEITEFVYTVDIATKGAEPREIPLDSIKTVNVEELGKKFDRKAVNKQCLFEWHIRQSPSPTWHDGQPVRAQDAVLAYQTIMNPYVDGAHMRINYEPVKSMEADGQIVRVELSKPFFRMKAYLAEMYLLPSHVINQAAYQGDDAAYADYFNKLSMYQPGEEPMIGNGPYRRVRWMNGEMVLERYPDYWASKCQPALPYWEPGRPYLDRIVYRAINETAAARTELYKGDVTVDFDVEPSQWTSESNNTPDFTSRVVRAKNLTPSYTYIGWNMERPIFQDARVRQALTMLIPRERILREVHRGLGRVQPSNLFLEGPVHDPALEPWPYNPDGFDRKSDEYKKWKEIDRAAADGADRLLKKARWLDRDNDGVLDHPDYGKFEFSYQIHTAREYHAKIADIIKEELGKHGIVMNIEKSEWAVFVDRAHNRQFDAVRFAWTAEIDPEPSQIFHSNAAEPGGSNYVAFRNEKADKLMEEIRVTFDFAERAKLNRELERLIWEESPYTFMFAFDELFFYSPKYRNVKFYSLRPGYDFTEWYVDTEWKAPKE